MHAKASTKCSYLTLENPHHQRQTCIKVCALEDGAEDNLSQIITSDNAMQQISVPMVLRPAEPISVHYGID